MQTRPEWSDSARRDEGDTAMRPAREEARGERLREIRRRVSDDAYRSPGVADSIARRLLRNREL